jgi:hypothetical protein
MSRRGRQKLFSCRLGARREGAVDRTLFDRIVAAVRLLVVHHVMQKPPLHRRERVARQLLRGGIGEDAVLTLVHQEHRLAGVGEDGVQAAGCIAQRG